MNQIGEYYVAGKPFPWHWGNSLYLEWFSTTNGRVVIESASYQLTISPDSTWDMTLEEEEDQRKGNAKGLSTLLDFSADSLSAQASNGSEDPETEAEAEKRQADSDRIADRVAARMESEGPDADYNKILIEEIDRARRERGEPDLAAEQDTQREEWIEEMNALSAEALEADKADAWKEDGERSRGDLGERFYKHPLSRRSLGFSFRVIREIGERGWINDDSNHEHPIAVLMEGLTNAAAKLIGALNGDDWPPELDFCANKIVQLKKAANHLDDAKLAADSCRDESLVDPVWLAEIMREINEIAAETDALIIELRARLEAGS